MDFFLYLNIPEEKLVVFIATLLQLLMFLLLSNVWFCAKKKKKGSVLYYNPAGHSAIFYVNTILKKEGKQ